MTNKRRVVIKEQLVRQFKELMGEEVMGFLVEAGMSYCAEAMAQEIVDRPTDHKDSLYLQMLKEASKIVAVLGGCGPPGSVFIVASKGEEIDRLIAHFSSW